MGPGQGSPLPPDPASCISGQSSAAVAAAGTSAAGAAAGGGAVAAGRGSCWTGSATKMTTLTIIAFQ